MNNVMDEKEKRKETNRRALKAVGIIGGATFLIVTCTMLITIISKNIKDKKEEKAKQNDPTSYVVSDNNFKEIMHF